MTKKLFKKNDFIYRYLWISAFMIIACDSAIAQDKWGIGASGLYNFTTSYPGVGARVLIPVKNKFWAVPYAYYYFPNNDFSGGISAMVPFYKYKMFTFYAVAAGTFRGSVRVSVNDSTANKAGSYRADGELGLGALIGPGCLKGFVEPRYAILNEEFILRAGAIYLFGCKNHSNKSKKKKLQNQYPGYKKKSICPAYDY
ncbi:MAG: hypothetical protein ABIJ97_07890 [Bacteroidota bacterium]